MQEPVSKRKRRFENEDAFWATTRVLMTDGYARLTLAAVGKELGCSAPALSKRFGSKRGLIEAYLEWSEETIRERFALVRGRFASPLEALLNRYLLPGDRPEEFGPFRTWTEAWSDTSLAEATYQLRRVWEAEA
ncbi:MAG: helix-turn-helix transcriptional regulator, partial [Thermomicrobiales bacterium]|nr:helix-turn-helix transcriptional regulator [Thermomicrobiales bacterium]